MAGITEVIRIQLQVEGVAELVALCEEARKLDEHGFCPLAEKMLKAAEEIVDTMIVDARKARNFGVET